MDTENCAEPRFPTIPPRPGKPRNVVAVLLLGARAIEEVPMVLPFWSYSFTATFTKLELVLTIATEVTKLVSSQVSVFEVAPASDKGTTAS